MSRLKELLEAAENHGACFEGRMWARNLPPRVRPPTFFDTDSARRVLRWVRKYGGEEHLGWCLGRVVDVGDLNGVKLPGVALCYARLDNAILSGAYLWGANLYNASLYKANLSGADLSGANLYAANLHFGCLSGANLSGVNLRFGCLSGADLRGADLSGADLHGVDLYGAIHDEYTRWPEGFTPPPSA